MAERPLALSLSSPFTVFSATNSAGRVVDGCLEFKRSLSAGAGAAGKASAAEGMVHISQVLELPHGLWVQVSLEEPLGWALQATVSGCASGRADTESDRSQFQNTRRFVWFLPATYTPEDVRVGRSQLQSLGERGSIAVVSGAPRSLFAITNDSGEVYRGFAEMAGPALATDP
jgi:hypothetical protein